MSDSTPRDLHGLRVLLLGTIAGKEGDLNELLAKLRPYLHLLAKQNQPQLGGGLDESDIVQETLMRMARGLDATAQNSPIQFRGDSVPLLLGWASRILNNVLRDRHQFDRAHKRDKGREERGSKMLLTLALGATPEEESILAECAVHIASALERLPRHQQDVLRGRFFDQLSYDEISERTGKSVGTLRVVCARAIARLATDEQLQRELETTR